MIAYYSQDIIIQKSYGFTIQYWMSNPTLLPYIYNHFKPISMLTRQYAEDSYTLDNYIYLIHKQNPSKTEEGQPINPKIITKRIPMIDSNHIDNINSQQITKIEYFTERKRKMSTQMSLFSWLVKDKPSQVSLLLSLDKEIILKIFSYMRISEVFIVSSVSSYLYSCSKHLWIDHNFFEQFETEKFSSEQLDKVIEKSKLGHIRQLRQIYMGKNIKKNREKIKMRVTDQGGPRNCILQMFSISPKVRNGAVFIMDSHLQNVLNSSYQGLQCIELHRCPYVKNFAPISRCIELRKFIITYNQYVTTQSLSPIFKRCLKLSVLQISECKNLEETIFKQVKNIEQLRYLGLRFFKQSFGNFPLLSECQHLGELNIDDSLITDDELMAGMRQLKGLRNLSIQGCVLLTNVAAVFILQRLQKVESRLREVKISRIMNIDYQNMEKIEERLYRMNLEQGPGQR